MGQVLCKSQSKIQWSAETIRRRGVRAVVAMLRLNKQLHELRREQHRRLEETKKLADLLRTLGESLRAVHKLECRNGASRKAIRNTPLADDRIHS